jgi:uncharacterized membrane protein
MTWLALTSLLWVGLHIGIAGTSIRAAIVARLGDNGFRGLFSVASIAALLLLVTAWRAAPAIPLWTTPDWFDGLVVILMLPVFLLFVASVAAPNPTAVAGKLGEAGPRGIQRITRHPMLWAFALWAVLHLLANGDLAAVLFFGALLVTALAGMPSIDAKLAKRDPETWARLGPTTSILPFGAVLAGRNQVAWGEIPLLAWILGPVAWLALILLHPWLFGVPVL